VRLNTATAGDSNNPLVICLHGFPQTGLLAWHKQYKALANAGYYVVMPDMRGYNKSGKPEAIKEYTVEALAQDVLGTIEFLKRDKAIVSTTTPCYNLL
jgi:pimeloyl-ACP methyl ester carboxylesterase